MAAQRDANGQRPEVGTMRVLLGLLAIFMMFSAVSVEAKVCGGEVECGCGDVLVGESTLGGDLLSCPGDGLRLRRTAVLDCDGHALTGKGRGSGLVLDRTTGAEVRNCLISGFRNGFRIRGGSGNRIEDNEILDNSRYGIDLSQQTTGNWIEGNLISASGDEGIHIGSGADLNFVLFNDIEDSGAENIYLLDVQHIFLIANNLSGSGSASIYMKHAQKSLIVLNSIEDRVVQVRGASHENAFVLNHLTGAGYNFEAYEENQNRSRAARGWTAPTANRVIGGSIDATGTCVRFSGASGNRVEGVAATNCNLSRSASRGDLTAGDNFLEFL
ncbi:MAG TPA: hypothetical protein DCG06_01790 [Deltaproteobacteria bacterium]|nr:hypothetical protein [Deltaproteobacteria bacterium]